MIYTGTFRSWVTGHSMGGAMAFLCALDLADSSILAQLGWFDMRLPILYTLSRGGRIYYFDITWPRLDFFKYEFFSFLSWYFLNIDALLRGHASSSLPISYNIVKLNEPLVSYPRKLRTILIVSF